LKTKWDKVGKLCVVLGCITLLKGIIYNET